MITGIGDARRGHPRADPWRQRVSPVPVRVWWCGARVCVYTAKPAAGSALRLLTWAFGTVASRRSDDVFKTI